MMQNGPDKAEAGQNQPAASHTSTGEDLLHRVMQQVAAKMQEGRSKDAVRLFVEAYNRGVLPKGPGLLKWLLDTAGKEAAAKLFLAFAHFPCLYCKGGLESCEACGGRGVRAEGPFCDTCVALGQSRCEFCDGTGLVTYSFFPPELWLPVIIDRSHLATRQLTQVLSHPIPKATHPGAELHLMGLIYNLNKLLGVLENAVLAAKQIAHHNAHTQAILNTVQSCNQSAAAAVKYLRQVIRSLAAAVRHSAQAEPPESAEAQFRLARAEFYENLAQSEHFERTCLHHPFLDVKTHP